MILLRKAEAFPSLFTFLLDKPLKKLKKKLVVTLCKLCANLRAFAVKFQFRLNAG
jgi:hypothetical protein